MAKDIVWAVVAVGITIGSLVLAFWPSSKGNVVVVQYDCRILIGGWHPDIPLKVQEECRKRSNK
jgi:hypothetical protein